ncbi:hypothetical protein [Clostridium sp. Marseille-P299]|uniref:hypothetical protein n=1 Tax=Clostridium sp. Marseille-P299 TaxID=1805477 RepID=UPI00082F31FF|nr:hypothetical protein [Clostridium sp. Marseille-P299]
MRKLLVMFFAFILILTACSKNTERVSLDAIPDDYSLEDAKSDGCVVYEDGDITYGQSFWDDFIRATEKGKSATIRLAFYYTLGNPSTYSKEYYEQIKDDYPMLYIKDLSYDGEKYKIEGFEDGQMITNEYKYMMKYEGQPNNASALFSDYTYYVLVNDNSVTWDDIEHGMFSSQFGDAIDHYVVYKDLILK